MIHIFSSSLTTFDYQVDVRQGNPVHRDAWRKEFCTHNTAVFDKRDLINRRDAGHHSRHVDEKPAEIWLAATYAAYNGGPSHLTRYRAAKQNPELKKVDDAFWDKFQTVNSGRELEVQRCYQK